ncbi:SynChlorMet cassette radical SAM/SPASM protein ScmF [Candidatus Saganbacteria bacterium CG08_land_8_20_14_0_20_45_16]|uniref:SynChlorMet cassette radical SAM/SPASM protein ScmF n=1 Tax=Candidatus Saganbacteria bacterium CG08_land_8_20_14_0_20_45_16 TaxID=2014293 RepID=A0A2H0XZP9_UNCSA|nr:MAG: SynChlorMet cassette radical SAM/SPASM protein ScmF [Candidatus Saganbacteria bacterium CG08_land_8_20_14_0_20_45_16]
MSTPAIETKEYKLNTIYFYLTEGCNLACRHCWIAPKFEKGTPQFPFVSLELFKSIVEQGIELGLTSVKLTGGEPLLHPQILELLDYIKTKDLRLVVETNGVLCTEELAKKIKTCKNPFVSVSLDGAKAESHEWVRQVPGCFEQSITGVKNLVKAGFKPQIIMSLMRHNKDEIEALVKMAEELGAGSIKFNLVQPTARGETMHEAGETLNIEELVKVGQWVENDLAKQSKIKLIYSHPAAFRPLGRLFGGDGVGCGTCSIFGIIGVLGNGKYALCGIGETVPELIFGDANKDRLKDVWENNAVLKQIREGLPQKLEGLCSNCVMKNKCLGNCIAQNYYSTKTLWASYWFCEAAAKAGLFPESRLLKVLQHV